jgi:hypothetical protein
VPLNLRTIFQKDKSNGQLPSAHATPEPSRALRKPSARVQQMTRQSRGIEQFFFDIRGNVGLSVLDFAGASQENIDFLTSLGHKIYTQDLLRSLEDAFGPDPAEQTNPGRIEYFLKANFDYPPGTFGGALLWDSFQFMGPALLNATVERLYEIMQPKSYILAFFNSDEKAPQVPSYHFRLVDNKTIQLTERGTRVTGQVFNNRSLERLFSKFESVKFFLTRDSLREVIIRR